MTTKARTPLRVDQAFGPQIVIDASGHKFATCHEPDAIEHAARIVQWMNAHDDLLAAAKAALADYAKHDQGTSRARELLRAAVAKVEGQ